MEDVSAAVCPSITVWGLEFSGDHLVFPEETRPVANDPPQKGGGRPAVGRELLACVSAFLGCFHPFSAKPHKERLGMF